MEPVRNEFEKAVTDCSAAGDFYRHLITRVHHLGPFVRAWGCNSPDGTDRVSSQVSVELESDAKKFSGHGADTER